MGNFSDDLRGERERQGLSLEGISRQTKISLRHLEALERGELRKLPGGVFRRGFLRSYLNALRLPESAWLPRFEEELRRAGVAEAGPADVELLALSVARARGSMSEPGPALRWSGVLAMLMLLLAFGLCIWYLTLAGHVRLAESALPRWPMSQRESTRGVPVNAICFRSMAA